MQIEKLSLQEMAQAIANGEITARQVTAYYIERITAAKQLNAVVEIFDDAPEQAAEMDARIAAGYRGKLNGIPVLIKDNICCAGKRCGCASRFLESYVAQYDATVIEKLRAAGAVLLGRTNMDEFAMGGSNEHSVYGVCHNAHDIDCVAGGSSGGSAVAVAAGLAPLALGTDTGGSVRQPASFNGVVGVKPTYGRVSRYGVVAFASSLEQVGPITRTVADNAYALEVLAGKSVQDETSVDVPVAAYSDVIANASLKGMRLGVIRQAKQLLETMPGKAIFESVLAVVKAAGATLVDVDLPEFALTLPCYYIIAPAEAASNLGRFDGVKYTKRAEEAKDVDEIYLKSRTAGFGKEVKRRIMLGNFVLSSGYYDAYYNKAKRLQQQIKEETLAAFADCDALLLPTTAGEAFRIGEKNDPLDMYREDCFTILANIVGLPAISIPAGVGKHGLPVGVQVLAKPFAEEIMYRVAAALSRQIEEGSHASI